MKANNNVDVFLKQTSNWLQASGPDSDIVVSSRIRLARNLEGYPFLQKLSLEQQREIVDKVEDTVRRSSLLKDAYYFRYNQMPEVDRQFLLERHLVSREHAGDKGEKAAAVSTNEAVSLMVIEEDHIRLQAFQSGFNLAETWRMITRIDDELARNMEFSFDPNLGYLTACPTNVGTGLRASCMLHLPSLVLTKQVHKVLQALAKLNLAARGLYGEGTQATGNFFQFSNQMTLGQNEEEIIDNLASVIRQVIEHEKEAREHLREKKRLKFEDQIWRAVGSLKSARMIASAEATQLLSLMDLGMSMGVINAGLTRQEMNALYVLIQPAHLQKVTGKVLNTAERDIRRAEVIREHLRKVAL